MTFSKRNQPFAGKFHDVLDKIKADMIQFTKKWNVKDTFAEYFCLQISVLIIILVSSRLNVQV